MVDGVSAGAVTTYTFSNVSTNHTISATFILTTNTITATSGANGSVTPAGTSTVNCGANITYTITPDAGFVIGDVLVDGGSVGAVSTYTFINVTTNHTISATFVANTYTITASAGANGSIAPNGATTVNSGDNITYTITPDACYSIATVTVDGQPVAAVGTYTFTNVTANHTISATFTLNTYTITATSGANGSVTPSGAATVNCGADATYTITPDACYSIATVTVDGQPVGAVGTYTFTNVSTDHTISATFTLNNYTITATSGANGSVTPSGAATVNCGDDATYTITPDACYSIATVTVDGQPVGAVGTFTFTNVTANHTISATFSQVAPVNAGTVSGASPVCLSGTATYSSNGDAGGTWSSSNTGVASVDATTGVVTGVSQGTANITYTVTGACSGPASASQSVTVQAIDYANLQFPGSATICSTGSLTAYGQVYEGGVTEAAGAGAGITAEIGYSPTNSNPATWTNWSAASFNVQSGNNDEYQGTIGNGFAPGTYYYTFRYSLNGCAFQYGGYSTGGGNFWDGSTYVSGVLTVNGDANAGTVSGTTPLCAGATATYSSTGDAGGTWSSTNTGVATVNATSGVVTAVGPGTTDITYTASGCGAPVSAFQTLTVTPGSNVGTVSGTSPLCIGASATYSSNGEAGGVWSSSNTGIATVDANTGVVTTVSAGTVNIIYTVTGDCAGAVSASQSLTVQSIDYANLQFPGAGTICASGSLTAYGQVYEAGVTEAGGAGAGIVAEIGYNTSNTDPSTWTNWSAASFNVQSGNNDEYQANIGNGFAPGTYYYTFRYSLNGCSFQYGGYNASGGGFWNGTTNVSGVLTVSPNANAGTVSGASPITAGSTTQYSSTGDAGGTWSSTNTSVATVSNALGSEGLVTAVAAGTTDITYTVSTGCNAPVSAFQTLTVNANTFTITSSAGTNGSISPNGATTVASGDNQTYTDHTRCMLCDCGCFG